MELTKEIFIDGILNKGWLDNNGVLTIPEEYDEFEGLHFYLKSDIKNLTFNINGKQKRFMDAVKKFVILGNVKDCNGLNFCEIKALEEVSIHGSFSELPEFMFSETSIKELRVPNNIKRIGMGAISSMPKLEKLIIPYSAEIEKSNSDAKNPTESKASDSALGFISNCSRLKEIILPEGAKSIEFVKQCVERENKSRPDTEKIKITYVKLKDKGPDEIIADLVDYNDKNKKLLYDYLDKTTDPKNDPDRLEISKKICDEITGRFDYLKKANLDPSKPLSYYEYYADEVKAMKSCLKYMIDIKIRFAKKNKMSTKVIKTLENLKIQTDKADSLGLLKEIWFNITHVFDYFFNKEAFYKAKNTVRLKKLDEFINRNIVDTRKPKTSCKDNEQQQELS